MTQPAAPASTPSAAPMTFHVYDTTLRDGAQQEGINLSVADKLAIAPMLDELGVGFIEGGWPGAVPGRGVVVNVKRRLGYAAWAVLARWTSAAIWAGDWPTSMSKSTPIRFGEAQRSRKVANPASEPQVNEPAAPPVAIR